MMKILTRLCCRCKNPVFIIHHVGSGNSTTDHCRFRVIKNKATGGFKYSTKTVFCMNRDVNGTCWTFLRTSTFREINV